MSAEEFCKRLSGAKEQRGRSHVFFLGAGCSVTSGIPTAGALVKDNWLPRLHELSPKSNRESRKTLAEGLESWTKREFPSYDPANPACIFGEVIDRLFPSNPERQREIERLCEGKFPGFGYAVLATLSSSSLTSFNVILTTNFDDLIADAFYLFTETRPIVIPDEALADFIRPTETRPLIVKLHGDNHLAPKVTKDATVTLSSDLQDRVRKLLEDRGLIFVGYGGRDQSILEMLDGLSPGDPQYGVYWVGQNDPSALPLAPWLKKHNACWVEQGDFDELMLLIRNACGLAHPDERRFERVFRRYKQEFDNLTERIATRPPTLPGGAVLREAAKVAQESFHGPWDVISKARGQGSSDPEQADATYVAGLEHYPTSSDLLCVYAHFLASVRNDPARAEEYYKRAIEADPNVAWILGNYAVFLETVRKDFDKAERYYKRAIEADPKHAQNLGNYALFLQTVRKDFDRAEEDYKRAVEADPKYAQNLSNYAAFLEIVRKDFDKAEEYYKRALQADPNRADSLGNYATFLWTARRKLEQAEEYCRRAVEADPKHAQNLGNYALFLQDVRKDCDKAEKYYKRAIEADPKNTWNLRHYADFLEKVRKDPTKAEELRRQAGAAAS